MKRILVVFAALVATVATAQADPEGADVQAAFVRCADVTFPAPLAGCGTDPLTAGRLQVSRTGDVSAAVVGASANASYDLILHGANVSSQLAIAVVATDAMGNGAFRGASLFGMNQSGIVAFTLSRNGSVEFVAGFSGERELEAGLVACGAVNTPSALPNCGTDALRSGRAEIEEGDVKVDLRADPNLSYNVVFRGLNGGTDVPLGMLTTDMRGKGSLKAKDVVAEDVIGAGNLVLQRNGADQFITGFQSNRKRPAIVARFQVGLLRCADVNTLAPLAGCGFDQLNKGDAVINEKGDITVHVMGAVALSTYEVVFVGADGTTEVSAGTFTTNPAGNGQVVVRDFFPVGARGVGQVIVKRNGIDQFVTGFAVSH